MATNPDRSLQLMAMGTACLCMVLIVGGLLLFVLRYPDSRQIPEILGSVKGGGAATGFVAVLFILYKVICAALNPDVARREKRARKGGPKSKPIQG